MWKMTPCFVCPFTQAAESSNFEEESTFLTLVERSNLSPKDWEPGAMMDLELCGLWPLSTQFL